MSTRSHRSPVILTLGTVTAALLLYASAARAQPPATSGSRGGPSAPHAVVKQLMRRDLIGLPGKEVTLSTIELAPGEADPPHRHDAQVFVYMLRGRAIMQVAGGPRMTLGPGQTFYESPTDVHTVSANASRTEPAMFLALLIKDRNRPATVLVPPGREPTQSAAAAGTHESSPLRPAAASASPELMRRDVVGLPGKEVVMSTVEVPPGHRSAPHRHNAQVFVYVLQGTVIMQVKGGPRMTLGPGQTFYESPTDIHTVSANASKTEPAKFLAILIKDKGKPALIRVPSAQAL